MSSQFFSDVYFLVRAEQFFLPSPFVVGLTLLSAVECGLRCAFSILNYTFGSYYLLSLLFMSNRCYSILTASSWSKLITYINLIIGHVQVTLSHISSHWNGENRGGLIVLIVWHTRKANINQGYFRNITSVASIQYCLTSVSISKNVMQSVNVFYGLVFVQLIATPNSFKPLSDQKQKRRN